MIQAIYLTSSFAESEHASKVFCQPRGTGYVERNREQKQLYKM